MKVKSSRRTAVRQEEMRLLDHISELRNGYEIVAYYDKKANRYHATIDPAAGFKVKYQVFSWHRNSSPVEDVTLSPHQQLHPMQARGKGGVPHVR